MFLGINRMDAGLRKAKALQLILSKVLADRRQRFNHAMVRSTNHRMGKASKPLAALPRRILLLLSCSKGVLGNALIMGPASPLSAHIVCNIATMPIGVAGR
jgi:hypothetical protein